MDSILNFFQENSSPSTIVAIIAVLLAISVALFTKGKGGC
jgi:hypothetical protein